MSVFFDTSVLVHAFTAGRRREKAQFLFGRGGVISGQVLNEFTSVARYGHKRPWSDISTAIDAILSHVEDVIPLDAKLHSAAIRLAESHDFRFLDATVVAAALQAGCDTLFSEDFPHGRVVDGLRIENPFL